MDRSKQASESGPHANPNAADHLITAFIDITSSTADEALFFLESHNFDLDAAVSTFLESTAPSTFSDAVAPSAVAPSAVAAAVDPLSASPSLDESSPSASLSPSRSRSPSPASRPQYNLRSSRQHLGSGSGLAAGAGRRAGEIRTFSDLNRNTGQGSDSDSDQPPEYYTGGEKSGMLVQDPRRGHDVDDIFDQARQFGAMEGPADVLQPSSSSRSFTGRGRLLSGETVSTPQDQPPETVTHTITFWQNGFTVDDGPLRMLDDPANATFLESIRKSECPRELEPADRRTAVHVNLARKDQIFPEPERRRIPFQGAGRTLGSSSDLALSSSPAALVSSTSLNSAPTPSVGLVVDPNLPTTSIQLRLADGTRMVSRFNLHHTVREIRAFIDASRPTGKAGSYKLQTMGFPPKQLTDLDQTIEQAGLANSVIIQRL